MRLFCLQLMAEPTITPKVRRAPTRAKTMAKPWPLLAFA